jgi:Uma2 family endonuclease
MAVDPKRYRFSRADYHRMAETGIIKPDARVELIDGDIVEMSPIGRRHNSRVDWCNRAFTQRLGSGAIVRVQGSIVLDDNGEPEPDLVLLRPRDDFYADADATPDDVYLIVEVADTSERYDRTKAPLYARNGIPELWIVNLNRDQVTRFLEPAPGGYRTTRVYRRGESIGPLAFPHLVIAVDDILG